MASTGLGTGDDDLQPHVDVPTGDLVADFGGVLNQFDDGRTLLLLHLVGFDGHRYVDLVADRG